MKRITVRHGKAPVSYGDRLYGHPTIMCNAPLSDEGFLDLMAALGTARWRFHDGDDAGDDIPRASIRRDGLHNAD